MSEEALRELLRSPLDDLPPRRAGRGAAVVIALLALVAGGTAGFGTAAFVDDETPVVETTTSTTTTSVAAADPVGAGEGAGLEVAWTYHDGEAFFVGVTTTIDPEVDRSEAHGIQTARWGLRLTDGREVEFDAEYASPAAQGMLTVEFPGAGFEPDDVEALIVMPMLESAETTATATVGVEELPWEGPLEGVDAGGITIAVQSVRIDDAGGYLAWTVDDSPDRRAFVRLSGTYLQGGDTQRFVPEFDLPVAPLQFSPGTYRPARGGTLQLFRLDDPDNPSFRSRYTGDPEAVVEIDGITFEWFVAVYRYQTAAIEVPLDGGAGSGAD